MGRVTPREDGRHRRRGRRRHRRGVPEPRRVLRERRQVGVELGVDPAVAVDQGAQRPLVELEEHDRPGLPDVADVRGLDVLAGDDIGDRAGQEEDADVGDGRQRREGHHLSHDRGPEVGGQEAGGHHEGPENHQHRLVGDEAADHDETEAEQQPADHDLLRDPAPAVPGKPDRLYAEPQHHGRDQGDQESDHDDIGPGRVAEQEELRGPTEHVEQGLGDREAGQAEDLGEAAQSAGSADVVALSHALPPDPC